MSAARPAGRSVILALGGGAARGMAHFGVIRTLERAGLRIVGVAGTSIGAAVGGAYLSGAAKAYEERMRAMRRKDVLALLDPGLPTSGLFGGARLAGIMRDLCGEQRIEDLEFPFVAVAVKLSSGTELRIDSGDLVDALRASGSIPGIFRPVWSEGDWLVDGALTSPVPLGAARSLGSAPIVAVNLNAANALVPTSTDQQETVPIDEPAPDDTEALDLRGAVTRRLRRLRLSLGGAGAPRSPGILNLVNDSIMIMCNELCRTQRLLDPPALYVEPCLGGVGMFDLHRTAEVIEEGERATCEALASPEGAKLLTGEI